ncbi:MAG: efflux RND transporter periplasmic adaptor subunit [Ignavibacteria bacterium]|jgi:RND family efflux transporter MFP subunit|nr:efflux RND transporter periplasmic adaptor subunit [Ignavibacteria bacterium]MCU7504965.1 efflux RND transporter periplasmic adaptor subunit [Ignavibacteria bacterium]MCU7514901.1 efflux RND transporter periplasmic adaptor subunit [Ignavibacteria bacterium]
MKRKYIVIISLVFIITVYIVYKAFFNHEKVQTVAVTRGNLITLIYATGTVTADSVATLRSEAGGIVKYIIGKEGMFVKKGAVLLRTDRSDQELRLKDAENQIKSAELDLEARERDLKRKESLYKTNSITKKDYEDAKQSFDLAKVSLSQKKLSLDIARQNLTKTEVTAPFPGVLVNVRVNLGDNLTPNAECFEILSPGSIVVQGEVDEQDLGKINYGLPALVAFDAYPNEKYEGVLERIVPRTDEATKTSRVYIKLKQSPEKLNLGMTATINIKADEKQNALLLPRTAILEENRNRYVFKVENERLKKIRLNTASMDGGRFADVSESGLSEGVRIVDQPKNSYSDNMKVDVN